MAFYSGLTSWGPDSLVVCPYHHKIGLLANHLELATTYFFYDDNHTFPRASWAFTRNADLYDGSFLSFDQSATIDILWSNRSIILLLNQSKYYQIRIVSKIQHKFILPFGTSLLLVAAALVVTHLTDLEETSMMIDPKKRSSSTAFTKVG